MIQKIRIPSKCDLLKYVEHKKSKYVEHYTKLTFLSAYETVAKIIHIVGKTKPQKCQKIEIIQHKILESNNKNDN